MRTSPSQNVTTASAVDRAKALRQFYTKPAVAKDCIDQMLQFVRHLQISIWIDPAAGEGAFLHQLPHPRAGMDVDPKAPEVGCLDFADWNMPWPFHAGPVVVIGTPPFGRNASGAIRFFNHAAKFADFIGFILPCTLQKPQMRRQLDPKFHLLHEHVIPEKAFVFNGVETTCRAVFQVWERRLTLRNDPVLPRSHPDFMFIKSKADADLSLQRVGVNAGRVRTAFDDRAETSHYFIRDLTSDRRVAKILAAIDWSGVKAQCVAVPSISKTELVRLYAEQLAACAASASTAPARSDVISGTIVSPFEKAMSVPMAANDDDTCPPAGRIVDLVLDDTDVTERLGSLGHDPLRGVTEGSNAIVAGLARRSDTLETHGHCRWRKAPRDHLVQSQAGHPPVLRAGTIAPTGCPMAGAYVSVLSMEPADAPCVDSDRGSDTSPVNHHLQIGDAARRRGPEAKKGEGCRETVGEPEPEVDRVPRLSTTSRRKGTSIASRIVSSGHVRQAGGDSRAS